MKTSYLMIFALLPLIAACNQDGHGLDRETIMIGTWECDKAGTVVTITKDKISIASNNPSGNFIENGILIYDNAKDEAKIIWDQSNKNWRNTGNITRSPSEINSLTKIMIATNNEPITCKNRH